MAASVKNGADPGPKEYAEDGRAWAELRMLEDHRSSDRGDNPGQLAMPFSRFASRALVKALENPKERVPAAVALLNRGWGLPRQSIETDPATSAIGLHLLAAQAISAQLIQRQSEPQPRTIQHEPQLQRLVDEPGPTE